MRYPSDQPEVYGSGLGSKRGANDCRGTHPSTDDHRMRLGQLGGLAPSELLERVQADQIRSWREGRGVPAELYLELAPGLKDDPDAVLDLVYAEVLLRRERGESPTLEDYQDRFPRFAEPLRLHFQLDPSMADVSATWAIATSPGVDASDPGRPRFAPHLYTALAARGYELLGELGRGGMGVVYKARQLGLDRTCALKMILAGAHATPETTLRLLSEAEAVARLDHPNIIRIHHIGEADGLPFLELEYLDGGSLAARVDGTAWPPRRAAALGEPLARAMAEAHRRGVVHRDLKPANVLLAADGTPKVTDFGLAKALGADSSLTRTNEMMGSPSYMAPEQAEGHARQVGPAADVHALGAILYELLTGRPPFRGATVMETLDQVKRAEPVAPSRLVPGVPRDLEIICLKCLEKDSKRRYGSAEALADDLGRWLRTEPIAARPVPGWEKAYKRARRHPIESALACCLAAVTLLGLAGIGWQWREAKANEAEAKASVRSAFAQAWDRSDTAPVDQ